MGERSEIEPAELHALLSADGNGPALHIDAAAQARLIDNVLAQTHAASAAHAAPARSSKRKLAWSVAAAFVLTGSAAAMYTAQRAREQEQPMQRPAIESGAAHRAPDRIAAPATPASEAAARPATTTTTTATTNTNTTATTTASPALHTKARVPSGSHDGGDDLLKRANRLRGAGDYRAAEDAYQTVVATNPHGAAAYAARVAAAGLRLERLSDPRGALRLYADALRAAPNGALAPEIHEGMATAYRALGRARDEQQTLRALLREQPSGPAAERARARLAVLDATP